MATRAYCYAVSEKELDNCKVKVHKTFEFEGKELHFSIVPCNSSQSPIPTDTEFLALFTVPTYLNQRVFETNEMYGVLRNNGGVSANTYSVTGDLYIFNYDDFVKRIINTFTDLYDNSQSFSECSHIELISICVDLFYKCNTREAVKDYLRSLDWNKKVSEEQLNAIVDAGISEKPKKHDGVFSLKSSTGYLGAKPKYEDAVDFYKDMPIDSIIKFISLCHKVLGENLIKS